MSGINFLKLNVIDYQAHQLLSARILKLTDKSRFHLVISGSSTNMISNQHTTYNKICATIGFFLCVFFLKTAYMLIRKATGMKYLAIKVKKILLLKEEILLYVS